MEKLNETSIGSLVRQLEQDYTSGTTTISEYVQYSMYDVINTIDAYLNSKHISGSTDSLGREKPFFNIVLAIRNIWFRATDLDRKNLKYKINNSKSVLASYIATIHLQKWMKDENFGQFLNDWGLTLASYGSAVTKFIKKQGRLIPSVVAWNKLIVDSVDFDNNPVIEVLELTPAQLRRNKAYDQEMVEKLIQAKTNRETLRGTHKDNKNNYIKLYEIHGDLPLSYLTGKPNDETTYVQQMHVVSFTNGNNKGDYEDFTLVSGREENPYMITHLIKEDGKTLSLGAVQIASEAQWMVNHTQKNIKDYLDSASKIVYQTADPQFANQNILKNIEQGKILVWNKDVPNGNLTAVNNGNHDIAAFQQFGQMWKGIAQEQTFTPDIVRGENMPAGTAYRQAAIIQQESHSNFHVMTQNKGLALEEMCRIWITPFIISKMDTTDELVATLDMYGIDKIDKMYIRNESVKRYNQKVIDQVIKREPVTTDLMQERMGVMQEMDGNLRFLKPSEISSKTWKDIIKDFEADVEYEITDENQDKQLALDTLSSVLQTISSNPGLLQDPNARLVFNKILEKTGQVSPLEIKEISSAPSMAAQRSAEMMNMQQNNA